MKFPCKVITSNCQRIHSLCLALTLTFVGLQAADAQATRMDEGFTEPFKTVIVASPESGVIQSLTVREGGKVQVGEIVAKLDSQVLMATANAAREKRKAEGKINGAKASLENKLHHLKQMQTLLQGQHASDKEVQQAQLAFDLANANLESAQDEMRSQEMEIKKIEAQLERRIVRAPISGVVLELPRQMGESITAVESHVATIVALDQLRVRYFLTTEQALAMKRGSHVSVYFPDTEQQANAIVDFVAPVTDSKSGTVRVELLIKNPDNVYRSGLRCLLGGTQTASQVPKLKRKF